MDFDAFLGSVVEKELIELGALDVPGAAAFARIMPREQEGRRLATTAAYELHANFLHERSALQLVEHAEAVENPVAFRHERLADFAARFQVSLQKQCPETGVGKKCGRCRAARTAANNNAIVFS